jgi:hypothetical protein
MRSGTKKQAILAAGDKDPGRMTPFSEFKNLAEKLRDQVRRRTSHFPAQVLQRLEKRFPGLQPDLLRKGWIPVSQGLLNEQLRRHSEKTSNVEDIALQCRPGHFLVTVHTRTGLFSHTGTLRLMPEAFTVDRTTRRAVFTADRDVQVAGRNTLGRISAWVAEGAFAAAVRRSAAARHVDRLSEGVVELDWPRIIVHLDRIEQVRQILDFTVLGFGLPDVLAFGPLRVEQDYAYLKVGRAGRRGQDSGHKPDVADRS